MFLRYVAFWRTARRYTPEGRTLQNISHPLIQTAQFTNELFTITRNSRTAGANTVYSDRSNHHTYRCYTVFTKYTMSTQLITAERNKLSIFVNITIFWIMWYTFCPSYMMGEPV
jgi:hypothetical protein